MFHGRPLNQSGVYTSQPTTQPTTITTSSNLSWPLTPQENNNLRASQSGNTQTIQVKFYLPDDEIRRSQIPANCTLQQVTDQIKRYASVADKDLLLAWNDDQKEWIRFDTDSEFSDAMNHARYLLSINNVFKIQAKEGKTPKKPVVQQQQSEPVKQPEPVQPVQPVQPPVTQPFQPVQPPVTQPPVTRPIQPVQPPVSVNPVNPFFPPVNQPMQPFGGRPVQPQVMNYAQPQFQPMSQASVQPMSNPMMMNQPFSQPSIQPVQPRNASPFSTSSSTSTPTKTLTSSVTMQQPHPLNSSFGSPVSQPSSQPVQPPVTSTTTNQPNVDPQQLATLRGFGFPLDDSVLIKVLQESNGDINVAVGKMLELNQ